MTQEEKAKRYDEALEELRGLLEGIREEKCKILEEDITSIFPELQDSEDEKIRKDIIEAVELHKDFTQGRKEEIYTWLEKQGENHDDKYNITGIKSKHAEGKLGEMIKEIKSTDKVEPKFKVKYAGSEYNVFETKNIAGVTYYGIEDEPNHIDYVQAENCERVGGYSIKEKGSPYPTKPAKFSEQKSTWSEEDEGILDEIIDFLENGTVKLQHDLSLYASWLKSLKDRVGCEVNYTTTKEWKPSDAQMIALNDVITNGHLSNANERILKGLQEQLKKLR